MLHRNKKSTLLSLALAAGTSLLFAGTASAAGSTPLEPGSSALAGGDVSIRVQASGDVRWILPGLRKLDPKVFGTPAAPLGFEPHVGVPIAARLTTPDGSAWTTTAKPTPFSDSFRMISGKLRLKAKDRSLFDTPDSKDRMRLRVRFTSPDGANQYRVTVDQVLPVGPNHPFMGGVGSNFMQHGMTGIGTKMMPSVYTYVAFWGIGRLEVNGVEVGGKRLVHGMTTCSVRDADYRLVFDDGVDCSSLQTHLILPPTEITDQGPVHSPVPSGFYLPNGMEQPFLHIMFGDNEVSGVETWNQG